MWVGPGLEVHQPKTHDHMAKSATECSEDDEELPHVRRDEQNLDANVCYPATLPETNSWPVKFPENGFLEDDLPFGKPYFQVL